MSRKNPLSSKKPIQNDLQKRFWKILASKNQNQKSEK